jgi:hypothetical protein
MAASATNTNQASPIKVHHYIRTFFATVIGALGLLLIIVSILALWVNLTVTTTPAFVDTLGPLVTKPAVQDFVVDKLSGAFLTNDLGPVRDVAEQLLPVGVRNGKTDVQLKEAITPIVKDSLRSIIAKPGFSILWHDTLASIHPDFKSQFLSNSESVHLNLHPVLLGVIDQFSGTKLSFIKDQFMKDAKAIPADMGNVELKGESLGRARKIYNYVKRAWLHWLPWLY